MSENYKNNLGDTSQLPEGWKRLESNTKYLELNFGSMRDIYIDHIKVLDLMLEMAEALDECPQQKISTDGNPGVLTKTKAQIVLQKFKEWK